MWEAIRNAWRIQDLRKKLLWTIGLLLIYRLMSFVPTPGVDIAVVQQAIASGSGLFGMMEILTGSAFANFTVLAMGIGPYITASIILQLLTVAIPKLEKMSKDEDGRKKIQQITRYSGVGLAFLQSLFFIMNMGDGVVKDNSVLGYITVCTTLTAGTAFVMWLADKITEHGIGNGVSMMIFAGIIAGLPTTLINYGQRIAAGLTPAWYIAPIVVLVLVIVVAVVFVDASERRIPIQYAKRMVGRKMYGGQSTHLPMRLNASGVLPLIFAGNFISFPGMIIGFTGESAFKTWWQTYMSTTSWLYNVLYLVLILGFTFFYSSITFKPNEIAENLRQHGGFIPGIRPGKTTSDYLQKISNRITFFGALFLSVLACFPMLFTTVLGFSGMGPTSILIVVSVALETAKQIESQMLMRHYKGFLR